MTGAIRSAQKIFYGFTRAVERIEAAPIGLSSWLLYFTAVVFLRNFFEGISQKQLNVLDFDNLAFFAHAYGFYFTAFVGIAILLSLITREHIARTSRFALFLSSFILLPPALDLLASSGRGAVMAYRPIPPPTSLFDVFQQALDFALQSPFGILFRGDVGGVAKDLAMNYGIRIEIALIFLCIAWYVYVKTKSGGQLIVTFLALYPGLYIISTFPYQLAALAGTSASGVFGAVSVINPEFAGTNFVLATAFSVLCVAWIVWWFFLYDRRKFTVFLGNIRASRLAVNFIMLILGIGIGMKYLPTGHGLGFFDYLIIAFAYLAVACRWLWAVLRNDLADEKADRISMPDRPLPQGALSRDEVRIAAHICGALGMLAALIVGWRLFFIGLLWHFVAYLYSEPPARLKRVPLISNALLAVAYLLTIIGGSLVVRSANIFDFPASITLFVLVGYTFGVEFKNIKDIAGDKADGVRTVVGLFGLERGRQLTALLGLGAFALLPLTFPGDAVVLIPLALLAWGAYYFVINRNPYREEFVFLVYFGTFAVIAMLKIADVIHLALSS